MHIPFNPAETRLNVYQFGGGGYFIGTRYQRGFGIGSILGSIIRFVTPYAKRALQAGLPEGIESIGRVAENIKSGRSIKEAITKEGANIGSRILHKAGEKVGQYGGGRKRKSVVGRRVRKKHDIFI